MHSSGQTVWVQGSAEALQAAIEALSTDTVRIKILHMGVGPVSKANIDEAAMTNARIIAFNVKTNGPGVEAANKVAGVQVCLLPFKKLRVILLSSACMSAVEQPCPDVMLLRSSHQRLLAGPFAPTILRDWRLH